MKCYSVVLTVSSVALWAQTSPIQMRDVTGLNDALNARVVRGTGFSPSRAGVINSSGQLDAAYGTLSDCVHVDGTSAPCNSLFVDGEVPAGNMDGANLVFTLGQVPFPVSSLQLFRNGLLLLQGQDYTLSGKTITFMNSAQPQVGDLVQAFYRWIALSVNQSLTTRAVPMESMTFQPRATSDSRQLARHWASEQAQKGFDETGNRLRAAARSGQHSSADRDSGDAVMAEQRSLSTDKDSRLLDGLPRQSQTQLDTAFSGMPMSLRLLASRSRAESASHRGSTPLPGASGPADLRELRNGDSANLPRSIRMLSERLQPRSLSSAPGHQQFISDSGNDFAAGDAAELLPGRSWTGNSSAALSFIGARLRAISPVHRRSQPETDIQ